MVPANGNDYEELFDKADQALEESKEKISTQHKVHRQFKKS